MVASGGGGGAVCPEGEVFTTEYTERRGRFAAPHRIHRTPFSGFQWGREAAFLCNSVVKKQGGVRQIFARRVFHLGRKYGIIYVSI